MGRGTSWRAVAARQSGLLTRAQLRSCGISKSAVAHRIKSERWQALSPTVIGTTTGELTRQQFMWLGVLHAGDGSLIGGLTAAELYGLKNWPRDAITVLVPELKAVPTPIDEINFVRTGRPIAGFRTSRSGLPCCRLEQALLMFGAGQGSGRTALGCLAAAVQQGLSTPQLLSDALADLPKLRRSAAIRQAIAEFAGGAQSVAELDINRLCRSQRLARPTRQVKRRDAEGRVRFTDCEWVLPDGRILVLEVDGAFHMEASQWEDDLARQRALTGVDRMVIMCTARELRDDADRIGRDLRRLGVPAA